MKRLALVLALTLTTSLFAQTKTLNEQAHDAYAQRDFGRSADLFAEAIRNGDTDVVTLYDAACANALAGRKEAALTLLEQTAAAGYAGVQTINNDPDLESLHDDPRFAATVAAIEANAKTSQQFWDGPSFKTPYRENLSDDEKVAGLSKFWSEAKYNFIGFAGAPKIDWDAMYIDALPKVRATKSTYEYYRVLQALCAGLHDGHTNVYMPRELRDLSARPMLTTRLIEDRVVLDGVYDEELAKNGLAIGQEVVAIDGMPVMQYGRERIEPYESASTLQSLRERVYSMNLLAGDLTKPIALTVRTRDGKTLTRDVKRVPREQRKIPVPKPFEWKMLPGNVAYVALNAFDDDTAANEYDKAFDEIAKADALILDVRRNGGGSSGVGYRVIATLVDHPFATSAWSTRDYRPTYRAWGRPQQMFKGDTSSYPPNGKKLYTKPVIVLTGPYTFSAAEDFAVAFDASKRGTIVGEATGGSTGQPLQFSLPGGGSARVCTKRDTYPDGKAFVGVGVQPNVAVVPKLEDFRRGKDTVLDAALKLARKK